MHDPRRTALAFTHPWLRSVGLPVMLVALLGGTGAGCSMCDQEASDEADASAEGKTADADAGDPTAKGPGKAKSTPNATRKPAALAPKDGLKPGAIKKPTALNGKVRTMPGVVPKPAGEGDAAGEAPPAAADKEVKEVKDAPPADVAGQKPDAETPPNDEMTFTEKDAAPPSATPPAPAQAPGFELDDAFNRNVVRRATDYKGFLRKSELAGVTAGPDYNAVRLRPTTPNRFGVSVQVWRIDNPGQQTRRFNDLFRQYPDTKRTRDLGDSAFTAGWGGLRYFVWLDRKASYLAAVSCDETICKDDPATLALARAVSEKLPETVSKKK